MESNNIQFSTDMFDQDRTVILINGTIAGSYDQQFNFRVNGGTKDVLFNNREAGVNYVEAFFQKQNRPAVQVQQTDQFSLF